MENGAFLQFTLLPKGCSPALQSKSCFDGDPMGGDTVKGSTWCETRVYVYGTVSQVSSLTTGLGDKRETSPAVWRSLDPLESNPLLAFAKVPPEFCSGTNKTLYLSWINSSCFSVQQGGENKVLLGRSGMTLLKNSFSP